MDELAPSSLEAQLLRELAEIERKIADLVSEKQTIQRIIARLKTEGFGRNDVARKNSFSRIMVENRVIEILRDADQGVSMGKLLIASRSILPNLKDSTFRSHLLRMKKKGIITNSYRGGPIILVSPKK